jgi:hypothetical protein
MSASEPRERLLAFVGGVVRLLPHVRQRENAVLYVRGLIEQGGRKSLQPTLFRLEETAARYESGRTRTESKPRRRIRLKRYTVVDVRPYPAPL